MANNIDFTWLSGDVISKARLDKMVADIVGPYGDKRVFDDNNAAVFGTGEDASIKYDGTNLLIQPRDVGSGNVIINDAAILMVNDTANAGMTVGLTINQGANDDEILALKSSDIAHGLISFAETDTYASFRKRNAAEGGLIVRAIAEDAAVNQVLNLSSYGGTADTTKTAAGRALIEVYASEHNGADARANVTADGNVFGVQGRVGGADVTLFLVDEDGDLFADGGTSTTNMVTQFDEFDDLDLIRAFELARADNGAKGLVRDEYDQFVKYNEADLVRLGILGAPLAEGGLTNVTRLQQLLTGAMWQMGKRLQVAEQRLAALGEPS